MYIRTALKYSFKTSQEIKSFTKKKTILTKLLSFNDNTNTNKVNLGEYTKL